MPWLATECRAPISHNSMRQQNGFTYSIIGYGRVGAALDAALSSVGGSCAGIFASRDPSKTSTLESSIHIIDSIEDLKPCDFVFICVPDDAIEQVSRLLPLDILLKCNSIVSHVSGSKPSSILSHLTEKSVQTAATHPLMTFKIGSKADAFTGISVSLEGDPKAIESLSELFARLGANPILVTPEQKKLLHLAAVIASNFMSSLVFHASDVLNSMDGDSIELVRTVFGPLMLKTAQNIVNEGYPSALTGPASRGDSTTIEEHLELLKKLGIEDVIYKELTNQILHYKEHK